MSVFVGSVALGAIVCKCCGKLIDTVDTEKVVIYYSRCSREQCINEEEQKK
ncbi:GapA-binding peptide SR1P [Bacillus sp. OTU530]|uniref:GapA-binding peptide SR1P n=1 Tax=Bacillus sp. OTU530 TaxID=3043862 RepID=UPI00313C1F14